MSIPVIQDPMLEKLEKIDARNIQQKIVDGLRGSGPGVKKISATTPKITMANSPRFGGLTAGGILKNLRPSAGGIVELVAGTVANLVNPHIARETVRGGLVLTGRDTTAFDRMNAGLPVVKNIDGVSYNISTEEGLNAALSAKNKGGKESKPRDFPQITKLKDGSIRTVGGDVYSADGKRITTSMGLTFDLGTGQSINPLTNQISETGYSIDPSTGIRTDNPAKNLTQTPLVDLRGPSAADLLKKFDDDTQKAKDEGMRIWAEKYKDTLAKKVKEGQVGFEVIQDTLYPNTEEGFANPNRPGVIEMIDGKRLEKPMSINEFNATQEVNDFDLNPLGTLSVLAQKDPQKALSDFMSANNLVGDFTTVSEPIVGSFPQKEYPLMTENYFGFGEYPLMTENYFGFGKK